MKSEYLKMIVGVLVGMLITDFILYTIAVNRKREKKDGIFITK